MPSPRKLNIAVACGGTGGHTFPGLATARVLRDRGHAVTLWLAGRAIENQTVKGWDGDVFKTGARPLKRHPAALAALVGSTARSRRGLAGQQTDVLLAMGSYASLPPVIAARLKGVPIVLHEANAIPGKAVAFLSRFAATTAISFAESAHWLPRASIVQTGLPVRTELLAQPPLAGFKNNAGFTVFITGGSQGAHVLNVVGSAALARWARKKGVANLRVIHQTGAADEASVRQTYAEAGVDAQVFAFLGAMGSAFRAADLAIGRAGAATCAEFCLCGVPSLLIPLPTAVRDHQRANAAHLVEAGCADLCLQADFTVDWLADYLDRMAADADRRAAMRAQALALAAPDAAERLADAAEGSVRPLARRARGEWP
jgi:UDP-N-acetylglucosamine--N-acetylmuramyl-(pentapeptide) pyrophosphoryl-undecaprenol N-acetylglucosamine transferase